MGRVSEPLFSSLIEGVEGRVEIVNTNAQNILLVVFSALYAYAIV